MFLPNLFCRFTTTYGRLPTNPQIHTHTQTNKTLWYQLTYNYYPDHWVVTLTLRIAAHGSRNVGELHIPSTTLSKIEFHLNLVQFERWLLDTLNSTRVIQTPHCVKYSFVVANTLTAFQVTSLKRYFIDLISLNNKRASLANISCDFILSSDVHYLL